MDRRKVALCLLVGGFLAAAYFMFGFGIAAPGTGIVNLGLMNDRTNGIVFGGLVAVVGTILYVTAPPPAPLSFVQQQPPAAPAGFWMDPASALGYPALSPPRSQTSLVAYRAQIRSMAINLSDAQSAWAWSHGVDARSAGLFVGYVETYRTWAHGSGMVARPKTLAVKAAYGIGVVGLLCVFGAMVAAAFPTSKVEDARKETKPSHSPSEVRLGETKQAVYDLLGEPDDNQRMTSRGSETEYWTYGRYQIRFEFGRVEAVNRF